MTHRLLDHTATPLGSFRSSTTTDILDAIAYWTNSASASTSNKPVPAVRLRSATLATRLLDRFATEVAANNLWAKDMSWTIAKQYAKLRKLWLDIDGRVGAENAEAALRGAVEEYFAGKSDIEPTVESFVSTAHKWLQLGCQHAGTGDRPTRSDDQVEAAERSAGILLYLTECLEISDDAHRRQISHLFHAASERLQDLAPMNETVTLLQKRVDQLRGEGWDIKETDTPVFLEDDVAVENVASEITNITSNSTGIPNTSTSTTGSTCLEDSLKRQFENVTQRADAESVGKVEAIFSRFESLSKERDTSFVIDEKVYRNLLHYYMRAKPHNAAAKAEDVLNKLIECRAASGSDSSVDTLVYNGVMRLWWDDTSGDQVKTSQRIPKVYSRIAEPNTESLNILLSSQLDNNDKEGMEKAMQAFYNMMDVNVTSLDEETLYYALCTAMKMKGNEDTKLMSKWRSKNLDIPLFDSPMSRVIEEMCRNRFADRAGSLISHAVQHGFKPDLSYFRRVIDDCVGRNDAISAAIILKRFLRMYRNEHIDIAPDGECFAVVLQSLFGSRKNSSGRGLLNSFLDLHATKIITFSSSEVTDVLEKVFRACKSDPSTTANLLNRLETMYDEGITNIPLTTAFYYRTMMATESRKSIQTIFCRLLERYKAKRDERLRPDTPSFYRYISTFVGRKCSAEDAAKAKKALELMMEMYESDKSDSAKPDEACFRKVIMAYIEVGDDDSLECANGLIAEMERIEIYDTEYATRNLLRAYAKSEGGYRSKAEEVFARMMSSYENGNEDAKPSNPATFSWLMETIVSEEGEDAAVRVLDLWKEMECLDIKADSIHTYNHVLSACSKGKLEDESVRLRALKFIVDLLNKRQRNEQISGSAVAHMMSYGHLLRVLKKLFPDEANEDRRNKLIQTAFNSCCNDGLLSAANLNAYREAAPPHALGLDRNSEPKKEWSRNVAY